MSKFLKDHPVYARMSNFIDEQVMKCRPSAIDIAMKRESVKYHPSQEAFIQAVAEEVDAMETRMAKRMMRYYGLNGKYVAH